MRQGKLHIVLLSLLVLVFMLSFKGIKLHQIKFTVPKGWPKPHYAFAKFPLTEEGFQLGRHLFYDPILSRDSSISCSSCHLQSTGFTHVDHAISHGVDGKSGKRNSMVLMNLAWNRSFMWDGGINHLEVQAIAPITGKAEMDETLEHVVAKLNRSSYYKQQFKTVFNDTLITGQRLLLAISQFLLELKSSDSKYDQVIRHERGISFSKQELNGLSVFRKNCSGCHSEPLFTNGNYENNGLALDPELNDIGRMTISHDNNDSLKFKVPTLRNIQFSKPYMHDGRFKKLSDVIKHYTSGIERSETLSDLLRKPLLINENEKVDLIAFLYTLTDTSFLFNPSFNYPRK